MYAERRKKWVQEDIQKRYHAENDHYLFILLLFHDLCRMLTTRPALGLTLGM